jgi:hypothetical protein
MMLDGGHSDASAVDGRLDPVGEAEDPVVVGDGDADPLVPDRARLVRLEPG